MTTTPQEARATATRLRENNRDLLRHVAADMADELADLLERQAQPVAVSSNMRSPNGRPRFTVQDGGAWIDDDDFIFDATLRIGGDFGDGEREAYAAFLCEKLNAAPPAQQPPI